MTDDADAEARAKAHGLIQGYIGPNHRVLDMAAFFSALCQALKGRSDERKLPRKYDVQGHLQLVGLICVQWAYLEYLLEVAVWWLEGGKEECRIARNLNAEGLASRACDLATRKITNAQELDAMYYIADEVVRLTPERNLAVHGRGQVNPDEKNSRYRSQGAIRPRTSADVSRKAGYVEQRDGQGSRHP